jgi:hypothetical protein
LRLSVCAGGITGLLWLKRLPIRITIYNEKEFRVALRHSRMGQRGIFPQVASLQAKLRDDE